MNSVEPVSVRKTFHHHGVSINYTIQGSGRPVLFLPGGGVTAQTYSQVTDALAEFYTIIASDLPCFGSGSVPNTVWGLEEYGIFFNALIESLHLNNVTVIGHSLGGGIGLAISKHNTNISGLILIDSAGKSPNIPESIFRYRFFIQKTWYDLLQYKQIITFLNIAKDFLINRIKKFGAWSHILHIAKKCLLSDLHDLHIITLPTLILWGKQDEIFPPALANKMHAEIPNSLLQIVPGNHDWALFRPHELATTIHQWLTDKNFPPAEQNQI